MGPTGEGGIFVDVGDGGPRHLRVPLRHDRWWGPPASEGGVASSRFTTLGTF